MYLPGGVPSAHVDDFAARHLPPRELWPVMDYASLPELARYSCSTTWSRPASARGRACISSAAS